MAKFLIGYACDILRIIKIERPSSLFRTRTYVSMRVPLMTCFLFRKSSNQIANIIKWTQIVQKTLADCRHRFKGILLDHCSDFWASRRSKCNSLKISPSKYKFKYKNLGVLTSK